MKLHQIKKPLHWKGKTKQSEEVTKRMGETIWRLYIKVGLISRSQETKQQQNKPFGYEMGKGHEQALFFNS